MGAELNSPRTRSTFGRSRDLRRTVQRSCWLACLVIAGAFVGPAAATIPDPNTQIVSGGKLYVWVNSAYGCYCGGYPEKMEVWINPNCITGKIPRHSARAATRSSAR